MRVLVIGNNCFSKSNSNGRTSRNLFQGWDKSKLAQFYIIKDTPDFDTCIHYYHVSDGDALRAIFGKKVGRVVSPEYICPEVKQATQNTGCTIEKAEALGREHKRSRLIKFARHFIWSLGLWKTEEFMKWVSDFSPQILWFVVGDCPFMDRIARDISRYFRIPIVALVTEDYCLKKYPSNQILRRIYAILVRRSFARLVQHIKHFIFNSDMLARMYSNIYRLPYSVIYSSSDLPVDATDDKSEPPPLRISYLGNIGVGRHEPLVEIGQVLQRIGAGYCLDVYGACPNDKVKRYLSDCPGIRLMGLIPYQKVIAVMKNSHILVHVENFAPLSKKDKKHAFSTKIADSLACGTCFFVYAPKEIAASSYLLENACAHVATDKSQLESMLYSIIQSKIEREKYISRAQQIALKNHDSKRNSEKVRQIMTNLVN